MPKPRRSGGDAQSTSWGRPSRKYGSSAESVGELWLG
jgi:hypothetical protein